MNTENLNFVLYFSHIFAMYRTDPKNPLNLPASKKWNIFGPHCTRILVNYEESFSRLFQIMFQNMIFGIKIIIRDSKITCRKA